MAGLRHWLVGFRAAGGKEWRQSLWLGRLRRVQRRLDRLRALEWRDRPGGDAVGFLCDRYSYGCLRYEPRELSRKRITDQVRMAFVFTAYEQKQPGFTKPRPLAKPTLFYRAATEICLGHIAFVPAIPP